MKRRKKRCWKGYKPVKGKRPYSKGSCRKVVRRRKIPLRTARAMVRAGLPLSRSELRGNQRRRTHPHYYVGGLSSLGAKGEERLQQRIFNQIKKSVEAENVSYGELATLASIAKSHPKLFMGEPRMAEVAGMTEARYRRLRGNPFDLPSQNELLRLKRADARGYAFTKKFSSKQPQALDMLISKLSTLKGNRDENLVTFFIRKRAKYPRDYIVILKHRKYVDGARVYSAGQKTEGAIGQFATILGAKAKRVGQSDYVFTTYGIRFPEERRKSRPGKLFGNPAKRDFHGDVYIGSKKVDVVFVRSVSEGSKKERELDVINELLSGPDFYELAWTKKSNGLYDIKKGFRVIERQ